MYILLQVQPISSMVKGNGFLYINEDGLFPLLFMVGLGKYACRNENVYGIVGLSTAMDVAYRDLEEHRKHIEGLKSYMIKELQNAISGVEFNGLSGEVDQLLQF